MKTGLKILFLFFLIAQISFSQINDKSSLTENDSTKFSNPASTIINFHIKFEEFEVYRDLNKMKLYIDIDGDPNTLWLRTSLSISNTENFNEEFNPNLLSPLERKYREDSKFDPVRYVLGAAQVGAVGYLAYKHIKKYGFLK